ncbi:MAG: hypothetical protein EZS28_022219 [Streblomastix strix]|uniref:Uncharacterized protein n=1 Tax=Streblomastix strix TaxID=222440 RepID=A0A5J4VIH4_9EUKA|nr:MAG: hypothetical protein EZS28_022219 [Streblomastix strix]
MFDSCTSNKYGGGAYLIAKDRSIVNMNKTASKQANSIFSSCVTSMNITDTETKGGILHLFRDGIKVDIISCERVQQEETNQVSVSSQYDIYGIFVAGCHNVVGSGLTATKVTLYITQSTFIITICYDNVIYLNQTRGRIQSCYFKGRKSTYHDPTLQIDSEEIIDNTWALCPGQSTYYSSTTHGLVYLTKGSYENESDQFEQSQVGAVKVDTADVVMNNISFIEPKLEFEALHDSGQNLVIRVGKSRLEVVDATINGYNEYNYY